MVEERAGKGQLEMRLHAVSWVFCAIFKRRSNVNCFKNENVVARSVHASNLLQVQRVCVVIDGLFERE